MGGSRDEQTDPGENTTISQPSKVSDPRRVLTKEGGKKNLPKARGLRNGRQSQRKNWARMENLAGLGQLGFYKLKVVSHLPSIPWAITGAKPSDSGFDIMC